MESNVLKFQKINILVDLEQMSASEAIELIDRPPIDNIAKLDKIKYLFENAKTESDADMYFCFWKSLFSEISLKKMRSYKISKILKYSPNEDCTARFDYRLSKSLLRDLNYHGERKIYYTNVLENIIVLAEKIHSKESFDPIDHRINYIVSEIAIEINSRVMTHELLSLNRYKLVSSKKKDEIVNAIINRIGKVKSLNLISYFAKYPIFAIDCAFHDNKFLLQFKNTDCAYHGNSFLYQFKESDREKIKHEIRKVWSNLYFKNHANLNSNDRIKYIPTNLNASEKENLQKFYIKKINTDEGIEEIRSTFTEGNRLIGEYFSSGQLKDAVQKHISYLTVIDIEHTVATLKEPEAACCDNKRVLYECIPLINTSTPEQCLLDLTKLCIDHQDDDLTNVLFQRFKLICRRFLTCKISDEKTLGFFISVHTISRILRIDPKNNHVTDRLRELEILHMLVLFSFRGGCLDVNKDYIEFSIETIGRGVHFIHDNYYDKISKLKCNKHFLLANIIKIIDNYNLFRFEDNPDADFMNKANKIELAAKDKLDSILSIISEKDISGEDSLDYLKEYYDMSETSKKNLVQIYINS